MHPLIVDGLEPITLVGGGQVTVESLSDALTLAPRLIAADGGAASCISLGHRPEVVIGDLDSLSESSRAAFAGRVVQVPDQSSSDFEKCLDRINAPCVLAVGFTGGRLDHTLAAIDALIRRPTKKVVLVGPEDVSFLVATGELILPLKAGDRISVMPMAGARVDLDGVRWPLADAPLGLGAGVSLSNEAKAGGVTLRLTGRVLVSLERHNCSLAMRALG